MFVRILWGAMAIYLFNISVDTADPNPVHVAEDLTINDQESIVELVVEQLLGFENAISEHDDPDTENNQKNSLTKLDLFGQLRVISKLPTIPIWLKKELFPEFTEALAAGHSQLNTPPPRI
tara:strand:+ start:3015 stop:3377 length:363 start_codon:yes stop_codon:yes gene_type:complete